MLGGRREHRHFFWKTNGEKSLIVHVRVFKVCLDLWENVILVFPDLMVNQESQELDFLGLQDLRVN